MSVYLLRLAFPSGWDILLDGVDPAGIKVMNLIESWFILKGPFWLRVDIVHITVGDNLIQRTVGLRETDTRAAISFVVSIGFLIELL